MLAIGACALYINERINTRLDLSANARHSLTGQSIKAVNAVTEPLQVTAVMGPDKLQREAVTRLFDQYQKYKPDIELEFVNLETQPARVRELQAAAGGELILTSGTREQRLQSLSERNVTAALTRLTRADGNQVAFITGHDERSSLTQGNSDLRELAARLDTAGLSTQEISLVTAPHIPDEIDLLVIAAPQRRYFPGEVASILDYLGRGGNLLWLLDESDEHGLQAIATELGISALPGIVLDASSSAYGTDSPTFVIIDQLPQHPLNQGIANPLLMPGSKALAITPLAGQQVLPLLQTGARSWTETGAIAGAVQFDEGSIERQGPLVVAASIERQKQHKMQRIAVVGDADWLASQWIGNGANLEYAERLFIWLTADDQLLAFETTSPRDAKIEASAKTILVMGGGFLFGMPLLLVLIASALWQRLRKG